MYSLRAHLKSGQEAADACPTLAAHASSSFRQTMQTLSPVVAVAVATASAVAAVAAASLFLPSTVEVEEAAIESPAMMTPSCLVSRVSYLVSRVFR